MFAIQSFGAQMACNKVHNIIINVSEHIYGHFFLFLRKTTPMPAAASTTDRINEKKTETNIKN